MTLSATLKLIKRKLIYAAPEKLLWVDSRRDNAEQEAMKVEVVVEFWQLFVPG